MVIEDSGPGIPAELRSKILEPFFYDQVCGERNWFRDADCLTDLGETWPQPSYFRFSPARRCSLCNFKTDNDVREFGFNIRTRVEPT